MRNSKVKFRSGKEDRAKRWTMKGNSLISTWEMQKSFSQINMQMWIFAATENREMMWTTANTFIIVIVVFVLSSCIGRFGSIKQKEYALIDFNITNFQIIVFVPSIILLNVKTWFIAQTKYLPHHHSSKVKFDN